jgi:hypothetical protein
MMLLRINEVLRLPPLLKTLIAGIAGQYSIAMRLSRRFVADQGVAAPCADTWQVRI